MEQGEGMGEVGGRDEGKKRKERIGRDPVCIFELSLS